MFPSKDQIEITFSREHKLYIIIFLEDIKFSFPKKKLGVCFSIR